MIHDKLFARALCSVPSRITLKQPRVLSAAARTLASTSSRARSASRCARALYSASSSAIAASSSTMRCRVSRPSAASARLHACSTYQLVSQQSGPPRICAVAPRGPPPRPRACMRLVQIRCCGSHVFPSVLVSSCACSAMPQRPFAASTRPHGRHGSAFPTAAGWQNLLVDSALPRLEALRRLRACARTVCASARAALVCPCVPLCVADTPQAYQRSTRHQAIAPGDRLSAICRTRLSCTLAASIARTSTAAHCCARHAH
jgi:hypothetical protein